MAQGWISLHRQIWDNELWYDKPFAKGQAWIDLLLLANHEPKKIVHGNSVVFVGRGSTVTSIRELAERWGWSRHKVVDFLDLLQSAQMAKIKSDTKGTVVTIANYSFFQDERTKKGHERDTKGTQKDTNNNDNNVININKSFSLSGDEESPPVENPVENRKAAEVWNMVLDVLKTEVSQAAMDTWFNNCRAESLDGDMLTLSYSNSLVRDTVTKNYGARIQAIVGELRKRGKIT